MARAAMILAAVAAGVLLWTWLGAAREHERALALAEREGDALSATQAREVRDDLRAAARKTPSTEPEVSLAQLELFRSRPRRAVVTLRSVLRREPDNATAWALLSFALRPLDRVASREAARREAELRGGFVRQGG